MGGRASDARRALDFLKVIFLAVLQGVTELFPVSSLGHTIVVPHLLRMSVDVESSSYLPFLTLLHVGTAVALFWYFRETWLRLLGSVLRFGDASREGDRALLRLLVLGTIPAGLLGLTFEDRLRTLFEDYRYAAAFLIVNGGLLFAGAWLARRRRSGGLAKLKWPHAVAIGAAQALALFPGISRSGVTLIGGLSVGLTHEDAARFAFLLATPIIAAAGVLEAPKLLGADARGDLPAALAGGVIAGVVAYASTVLLMRYFRRSDAPGGALGNALAPFGVYSIAIGALALFVR